MSVVRHPSSLVYLFGTHPRGHLSGSAQVGNSVGSGLSSIDSSLRRATKIEVDKLRRVDFGVCGTSTHFGRGERDRFELCFLGTCSILPTNYSDLDPTKQCTFIIDLLSRRF